jgi:hypothetical protein
MANTQILLEIETGAGSWVPISSVGSFNDSYQPIYNICFGGRTIDFFHNLSANTAVGELSQPIKSLQAERTSYLGLTQVEQGYRLSVLEVCVKLRDLCIKHPNAFIFLAP